MSEEYSNVVYSPINKPIDVDEIYIRLPIIIAMATAPVNKIEIVMYFTRILII